jgi:hypothetical protein
MPLQKNVLLTGRIGNLIFYKRQGIHCVRAVPARVRQTKATKVRATEFGKASRTAAAIREQMADLIPFPTDNQMQTRLLTAVFQWLKESGNSGQQRIDNLDLIRDFRFTAAHPVQTRWKIEPRISIADGNVLQIELPEFVPAQSIRAPAGTNSVELRLSAAACDPGERELAGGDSMQLLFDYNKKPVPAQTLSLKFPMPKGSLVVLGASLQYTLIKNGRPQLNANKAFMPAGMLEAFYIPADGDQAAGA